MPNVIEFLKRETFLAPPVDLDDFYAFSITEKWVHYLAEKPVPVLVLNHFDHLLVRIKPIEHPEPAAVENIPELFKPTEGPGSDC